MKANRLALFGIAGLAPRSWERVALGRRGKRYRGWPRAVLWGLDYEVTADRYLFDRMRSKAPEGPAKAAVEALHEKSAAAWKTVSETKNPGAFFSFSASPDILAGLRQAWRTPTRRAPSPST